MSLNLGNIWAQNNNIPINITNRNLSQIMTVRKIEAVSKDKGTKGYWGTATWFLFHSIAARIEPVYYKQNYLLIWQFIEKCCSNLPCPYCRTHATQYVSKISHKKIDNKEKLRRVLFDFHNSVNQRTRKPILKYEEIEKYKTAKLYHIFKNFEIKFFKTYFGSREFSGWLRDAFKKDYFKFKTTIASHFV